MSPTALITGPTAGIGFAFANKLAQRGTNVVLVSRDEERLTTLASRLSSEHQIETEVLVADLKSDAGRLSAAERVSDPDRPVDLLVNNAGSSLVNWFGTSDIADESGQLDLLVRAPMYLMDAAIKAMVPRGYGAIINVASVAAFTPRGTYSAHKAWLVNLSRWANITYGAQGIVIQALCPGFVRTEFHQRMGADISKIPDWMWLNAEKVVTASLADLDRQKAVSIPSLRYKVLASLAQYTPSSLVAAAAKRGR